MTMTDSEKELLKTIGALKYILEKVSVAPSLESTKRIVHHGLLLAETTQLWMTKIIEQRPPMTVKL